MQGRLLPPEPGHFQAFPRTRWREEFALAAEAGLDSIEWICDVYGEDVNPIADGIPKAHGIAVNSLCADYFMDLATLDTAKLTWILDRCAQSGISRIVLPFVDGLQITNPELVVAALSALLSQTPLEIHLETSLSPRAFADLLDALPHPRIKVTYDSGNSASLGYSPAEEFTAYGDRIGSIHIKDRALGGGTVPLGTGAADFHSLFHELRKIGYQGDYILQTAREEPGAEVALAKRNLAWLKARL